ncbi:hypothetical protein R4P64_07665 [Rhodococcus sp. IEGM 1366]|uniref:hypothetical protein n=1 Tax=Rhodococcus sp. IEGM 1366 TaxID=3082223 RepID=UPI002954F9C5|nr:hypothetical protein [Rhodococcus sp. IEGM 1366]MDV8066378.1 hypothetical protein [Rhodococcus sp. IEGM 1366]
MFNHPAFWPAVGAVIVSAITALATYVGSRRSDRVNLLEQQRKDFDSILEQQRKDFDIILDPLREDLVAVRLESAANKAENATLRAEVDQLKKTDHERDGLLDDLLTWARATIQWIADRMPGSEERPQLSERAWNHLNRQEGPPL